MDKSGFSAVGPTPRRAALSTRALVYAGVIAAAYVVVTLAVAPLAYGPLQFRVSNLLKPLALLHPVFALSFGLGTFLTNTVSPFGVWDQMVMPLVDVAAALLCWQLRRWPVVAVLVQAMVISLGVAVFPLGMGAGLPFLPTFAAVVVPQAVLLMAGYFLLVRGRYWQEHQ